MESSCKPELRLNSSNMSLDLIQTALRQMETTELPYKVPTFIFLVSLIVVGIPGNLIVCYVYYRNFPSGPSRSFILGLAVFDIIVCFIGVPFEIADLQTDYFLDLPALCKIVRFSNTFASAGSCLTLLVIAVYRYKKICLPFKRQMSKIDVRRAFIGVGLSSLGLSWPALVFYGNQTSYIGGFRTTDCSYDDMFMDTFYPQIYQIFLGTLCVVMIVILSVLYTLIIIQIIKQKRRGRALGSHSGTFGSRLDLADEPNPKLDGTKKKTSSASMISLNGDVFMSTVQRKQMRHVKRSQTTIIMLLVTVAFIVSYMPHVILQVVRRTDSGFEDRVHCKKSALAAYRLFLRSFFLNSAINPIIYGFYNKTFRGECKRFCLCLLRLRQESVQVTTASSD